MFNNFIGEQLICNVVLVSGVQQSESVIHIYILSTLFFIPFPCKPLQSIKKSSLCYTNFLFQLPILCIVVCVYQSPNLSLHCFPPGVHKFVFYICDSISALWISSFVSFFRIPHIHDMIFVFFSLTYFSQCDSL